MFKRTTLVIDTFGKDVVKQAQKNLATKGFDGQIKGRKKDNTGKLSKSLGYSIRQTDGKIIISFKSGVDYAGIVEEGRSKGAKMPPYAAINKWVAQRRIVTRNKKGQFETRQRATERIRRSIAKQGIKPVRFFSLAMNEVFEMLPPLVQTALVTDLEDLIFDNFTKAGYNVTKS